VSLFLIRNNSWKRIVTIAITEVVILALEFWLNSEGHGTLTVFAAIAAIIIVPVTDFDYSKLHWSCFKECAKGGL